MPFTFKLSKRLALLKASCAVPAAAALAACERVPATAPQTPSSPVVQIVTLPDSVTLNPSETRQFVAYGRTQAGDSVPVTVSWRASGGTITGGGLYTADTVAGSYQVTATAQVTGAAPLTATATTTTVSGSSVVKNRGPLAQIILNPTTASVLVGGTVQFKSYGRRKNGDSVAVSVVYTATGGAVSTTGLYTAGQSAGSYRVMATQSGGTLADTAPVAISAVPVASVTVTPASASLTAGQTVQLAAVTKDSAGNVLTGRTVSWATSNSGVATVSAAGLVTGVVSGSAIVTATSESQSGTAALTVTTAVTNPGTVTDLAVVGVADTGVTLAFTEVNDGTGLPASYDVRYQVGTITWGSTATSVTGGTCATPLRGTAIGAKRTCTVLGLTPATGYQFQLVAFRGTLNLNAVFGGLSNVAGATTAPDPISTDSAPQPGPTSTMILQDGFESGDLSLWTQSPANGRYSVATDPTRVHSGARSLQVLFTPTNTYGMITRWFMPGYDEVYVKFSVMFEENFDESSGLHFLTMAGNNINDQYSSWGKPAIVPNGTDYFYAGVDPEFISGDAPLKPLHFYTYWPDMTCCYGNRFYQSSPKIPLVGGQWQAVVFHIKLNTPGQYDGSQTLWINGVKKIDVQNLRWRTTTDLRLNEIRFDDYMSQGPTTEHLWIDDVTVWRP
jgi:hypothetical protein